MITILIENLATINQFIQQKEFKDPYIRIFYSEEGIEFEFVISKKENGQILSLLDLGFLRQQIQSLVKAPVKVQVDILTDPIYLAGISPFLLPFNAENISQMQKAAEKAEQYFKGTEESPLSNEINKQNLSEAKAPIEFFQQARAKTLSAPSSPLPISSHSPALEKQLDELLEATDKELVKKILLHEIPSKQLTQVWRSFTAEKNRNLSQVQNKENQFT